MKQNKGETMTREKELLEELFDICEEDLSDRINWFKKNSKDFDDEDFLGYLIWLKSSIKDCLKQKKKDDHNRISTKH
tara:strand:- start:248 stop:478 length:231 start_codon:yes stop_codon:yes gene_type:complete